MIWRHDVLICLFARTNPLLQLFDIFTRSPPEAMMAEILRIYKSVNSPYFCVCVLNKKVETLITDIMRTLNAKIVHCETYCKFHSTLRLKSRDPDQQRTEEQIFSLSEKESLLGWWTSTLAVTQTLCMMWSLWSPDYWHARIKIYKTVEIMLITRDRPERILH